MNAEELLRHYERVADAPDAVDRLRRFVLDLAVRGRLVPQDGKDSPASTLLNTIAAEKVRLGVSAAVVPLDLDEVPFPLPLGWSWSRVGEVCSKTGSGSTPRGGQAAYKTSGIPFLRSQNVYDDGLRLVDVAFIDVDTHARMAGTQVRRKDLLLNITGGSIGRCCRVPDNFGEANVSQHVAILRPAVPAMSDYLHKLVLSPYFQWFVDGEQTGAGRGGLPKGRMDQIAVAVPPLAEQQRIVAKVDELMSLCDKLEAARAEREAARDRLSAASLARLNARDPETFADDARFALDALLALTTRPDQIEQLRRTILNLAVRGGLAFPHAQHEEPVALGTVAKLQNGYAFKSEWFAKSGVRLLRNTNVAHGVLDWHDTVHLPAERTGEFERFNLREGDVVLSLDRPFIATGTKVATVSKGDLPALLLQRVGRFLIDGDLDPSYLLIWINSPHFAEQIDPGRSNGVPHVSSKQVESAKIFLPSLDEQRRIVVKVRELLSLCDQLEADLHATGELRSRLLEKLRHDALDSSNYAGSSAPADEPATAAS
jgi:type I restriction enzyme S subunit